ncbi:hypothetical protein DRP04_13285 [Archaeoglobales archaeon]|nr:MAG: hypothetical protein DRP04_13285 [Archaeoglobales archaeon]
MLVSSESRIKVLDALTKGETKEEIRQHIPKSALFHALNSLKKAGFIKDEHIYLELHQEVTRTLNYLKSSRKVT